MDSQFCFQTSVGRIRKSDQLDIAMQLDSTWCQELDRFCTVPWVFWVVLFEPGAPLWPQHNPTPCPSEVLGPVLFGYTHMPQGVFQFHPWTKEMLASISGDYLTSNLFNLHTCLPFWYPSPRSWIPQF